MKATWLIENLSHEDKSLGPRMPVNPDQCLGTVPFIQVEQFTYAKSNSLAINVHNAEWMMFVQS